MPRNLQAEPTAQQVRVSDADELHVVRLAALYPDVAEDSPDALRWAGRALRAAQDEANGHTKDIVPSNQSLRFVQLLLSGEKKAHLVHAFVFAMKGRTGRAVALAICRGLAAALGYEVAPRLAGDGSTLKAAVGTILRHLGHVVATSADALSDNVLTPEELDALDRDMGELETRLALYRGLRARMTAPVAVSSPEVHAARGTSSEESR